MPAERERDALDLHVKTWDRFVSITDRLDIGDPIASAYAFRGQADSGWPLRPSLLRKVDGLSATRALALEKAGMEAFRTQAHLHISTASIDAATDVVSWGTLMQHHQAPTRLLDWTMSPFVAAYFAVDREPDKEGAVWLFHLNALAQRMKDRHGDAATFPEKAGDVQERFSQENAAPIIYAVRRMTETDRMAAQHGAFTVSNHILADHGELIAAALADNPERSELFRKLLIPADQKLTFLRRLHSMGITARALFPGVDGLGRTISELISMGAAFERGQLPSTGIAPA